MNDSVQTSGQAVKPVAVVLGGKTGLLGQALVHVLVQAGYTVHAFGRLLPPPFPEQADMLSLSVLEDLILPLNPALVFNTIAYTAVDQAEDEPEKACELNRNFPATLVRALQNTATHLFHYSTDFVFNGKKRTPYTERDATDPLCVYGKSKLAGEAPFLFLPAHSPLKTCVIRTAWLFGPGKKNFVASILAAAEKGDVRVVHDQVGSPTYTPDLAAYSLALAKVGATGRVHVANAGQASWCELASEAISLRNISHQVAPIRSDEWPQKAMRPAFSVLDTGRFTELTGIHPRPWPQALREYLFKV